MHTCTYINFMDLHVWIIFLTYSHIPILVFAGLKVKFPPGTTFWAITTDRPSITDSNASEALYVSYMMQSALYVHDWC